MTDAIALRNRFAMVKGAWDDHLPGVPFPALGEGTAEEKIERLEIRLVPGPAAKIAVTPAVSQMVVGQRVMLLARSYSRASPIFSFSTSPINRDRLML